MVTKNSSNYFISRIFRAEDHPDHKPIHIIEELFSGKPRFLVPLVEALLRKGKKLRAYLGDGADVCSPNYIQSAAGIWIRHNLEESSFTP